MVRIALIREVFQEFWLYFLRNEAIISFLKNSIDSSSVTLIELVKACVTLIELAKALKTMEQGKIMRKEDFVECAFHVKS